MKRIGEAVRVAQGLIVVRSPDEGVTDVGTTAITEDLQEVGQVVEVFGPVQRPYVSIAPTDDVNPAALVGGPLYAR